MINFIKRLFGYDDKFFNLLDASAIEAKTSVQLLVDMLKKPSDNLTLEEFARTRRNDKRITEQITEELCKTFVTPLEREDIEALSVALYKIPKTVEKFSEKFILCRGLIQDVDFMRQVSILQKTTDTVAHMVKRLRQRSHLEKMKEHIDCLHRLEGDADKVMMELMRDLYSGKHDTLKVIITLDLYETLEEIIDRCRDAGNVIFQIILKYS